MPIHHITPQVRSVAMFSTVSMKLSQFLHKKFGDFNMSLGDQRWVATDIVDSLIEFAIL
jgi:hypothetical protein